MAAAFANKYGSDVVIASSAGLSPAISCSSLTRKVMLERNVDIGDHLPRAFDEIDVGGTDLIVNMSGYQLPGVKTLDWQVSTLR